MSNAPAFFVLLSVLIAINGDILKCNTERKSFYLPKIQSSKPEETGEEILKKIPTSPKHGYKTTNGLSKFNSDKSSKKSKMVMNDKKLFENAIPIYYLDNYEHPSVFGFVDNTDSKNVAKSSSYTYNKYNRLAQKPKETATAKEAKNEKPKEEKPKLNEVEEVEVDEAVDTYLMPMKDHYRQTYTSPDTTFWTNYIAHLIQENQKTDDDKKELNEEPPQPYQNYQSDPHYEFEYTINDPKTNDKKYQKETRDGSNVRGEYSFMEPDGSFRIVKYKADKDNGFQAEVSNEKSMT